MKLATIRASVLERLIHHTASDRDTDEATSAYLTAEDPDFGGRCPWCGRLTAPNEHRQRRTDDDSPRLW